MDKKNGKPAECRGNHERHLCVLAAQRKIEEIKKLADKPKFICNICGRVANQEASLCEPTEI